MATTELKFLIKADASGLVSVTDQAGRSLRGMGDDAVDASDRGKTAADNFWKSLDGIGTKVLTGLGLAGLTSLVAGFGTAALQAGIDVDDAMDKIRVGTGATDALLGSLEVSFKNVFRDVPADAATVATAIADLNTRLDLTGVPLETLATQFLNLSRITGTDVKLSIESATRVFGDWSIATDDASEAMDFLFKTSQSTGVGVDKLGDLIVRYGAPLRQFGFDFEDAAVMMGKFEKEGVNTELVMGSLRIALGKASDKGVELSDFLRDVTDKIKKAGSAAEANSIAFETFGARAGADMAAAIREGRFEIEDLLKVVKNSPTTINSAAESTDDFAEKWQTVKNNVTLVLEPLGTLMMEVLGDVTGALGRLIPKVSDTSEEFNNFGLAVKGANTEADKFAGVLKDKYGIEISKVGKSFGEWTGEMVVAEGELKKLAADVKSGTIDIGAMGKATTEGKLSFEGFGSITTKVGGSVQDFTRFTVKNTEALDKHTGATALSEEAIEKQKQEMEKLIEQFDKALNPTIDLEKKIRILESAHKSAGEIAFTYGGEIQKAGDKAREHGAQVGPLTTKYELFAKAIDLARTAAKKAIDEAFVPMHDPLTFLSDIAERLTGHIVKMGEQIGITKREYELIIPQLTDTTTEQEKVTEALKKFGVESELSNNLFVSALKKSYKELLVFRDKGLISTEDVNKAFVSMVDQILDKTGTLDPELAKQLADIVLTTKGKIGEEALAVWKDYVEAVKAQHGKLPIDLDADNKQIAKQTNDTAKETSSAWEKEISTIVNDWAKGIADIIFDGGSMKDKLIDIAKDTGKGMLRSFLDDLFKPLKDEFKKFVSWALGKLGELLGFDWGGIFGGGGSSGGTGGIGTGGAGGIGGTASLAKWTKAGWGSLGKLGGWIGKAALAHPWIAGAIAGGLALWKGIDWAKGKNAFEAGSIEALRDFDVGISEKELEDQAKKAGLTEKTLYPIRKDFLSSPTMLTGSLWSAAKEQGREESFLSRLEKVETAWGTGDFRKAFEKWRDTGEAGELNKKYKDLFSQSGALKTNLPNWEDALLVGGSTNVGTGTGDSDTTGVGTGGTGGDIRTRGGGLIGAIDASKDAVDELGDAVETFRDRARERFGDVTDRVNGLTTSLGSATDEVDRLDTTFRRSTSRESLDGIRDAADGAKTSVGAIGTEAFGLVDIFGRTRSDVIDDLDALKDSVDGLGRKIGSTGTKFEEMGRDPTTGRSVVDDLIDDFDGLTDRVKDTDIEVGKLVKGLDKVRDWDWKIGDRGKGGGSKEEQALLDKASNWENTLDYLVQYGGGWAEGTWQAEDLKLRGGGKDALRDLYEADPTISDWVDKFAMWYDSVDDLLNGIDVRLGGTLSRDWGLSTWKPSGYDWGDWGRRMYADGGPVSGSGPGYLHDQEYVVPRGGALVMTPGNMPRGDTYNCTVVVENAWGMDDLDRKISESVTRTFRRGGLRQMLQQ